MSQSKKNQVKGNPLMNYFKSSVQELRKVTWPTHNQTIKLTFLVLGISLGAAVLIGLVDYGFSLGHRALLDLRPSHIQQTTTTKPASSQPIKINPSDVKVDAHPVDDKSSASSSDSQNDDSSSAKNDDVKNNSTK